MRPTCTFHQRAQDDSYKDNYPAAGVPSGILYIL